MWVFQLIYEDKHDTHYNIFSSYAAAGEQVREIITKSLETTHLGHFEKTDLKKLREHLAAGEFQDAIDMWNEGTLETLNIEEFEVQGSSVEAERRNVHAVLVSMAHQVLVEEVVGIRIEWEMGSPIRSNTVLQARFPVKYMNLQLPLPVVDNDGYKNPDES